MDPSKYRQTLFGIVPNLDFFFEEFVYGLSYHQPHRGSGTHHPRGFYFMSSEHASISSWYREGKNPFKGALYVKPKRDIGIVVRNMCCEANIGSFSLIPWPSEGHALVKANDRLQIANPFLGFVPLEALPEINQHTIGLFDGKELHAPQPK